MPEYDPRQMKILLVEDQAWMRKIEIKILNNLGFTNIIEAEDGHIAIDLLNDNDDMDLIVSDWDMPNKDGYELLVWVRDYKKYKNIPFIMAPAQADREQLQKAQDAGVSCFMPKPFTPDGLKKSIDDVFGAAPMERESLSGGPAPSSGFKLLVEDGYVKIYRN